MSTIELRKSVTFVPNEANCLSTGRQEAGLAEGQTGGGGPFCVIPAQAGIQKETIPIPGFLLPGK